MIGFSAAGVHNFQTVTMKKVSISLDVFENFALTAHGQIRFKRNEELNGNFKKP